MSDRLLQVSGSSSTTSTRDSCGFAMRLARPFVCGRGRQSHGENTAPARFALHAQATPTFIEDGPYDGKPEAEPAGLGRVEGFEDAGQVLPGDADPGIGDGHFQRVAGHAG